MVLGTSVLEKVEIHAKSHGAIQSVVPFGAYQNKIFLTQRQYGKLDTGSIAMSILCYYQL